MRYPDQKSVTVSVSLLSAMFLAREEIEQTTKTAAYLCFAKEEIYFAGGFVGGGFVGVFPYIKVLLILKFYLFLITEP